MDITLLTHIQKFIDLRAEDAAAAGGYFSRETFPKKALLLRQDERCRDLFFVIQGCLRMFFITEKGNDQTIQFALEDWWISDFMNFDVQGKTPFSIQAIEDTVVLRITQPDFERLLADFPQMERYFRLMYQRGYAASQLRMKFLTDFSKEQSYRHFHTHFPAFARRIPQQLLASYLQMTPEYLSELKRKLKL